MLANPDPKFQNSKFLRFVTRLNKGELVIQGNTIIEKAPELDAAAADARSEAMKANMLSDFAAFQQAQGPSVADFAQFQQAQGPSAADFAAFQATQGPSAADFAAFQATQGPSAADFAAFQATQGPSAADFAAFQAAQGPSAADFAQFQAAQGPSAADFVSPHIQRLACRIRADPFCPRRPHSRLLRALRLRTLRRSRLRKGRQSPISGRSSARRARWRDLTR